ncbi:MAG: DUF5615 family PIN-like protein [Nitrospirota bacterium]
MKILLDECIDWRLLREIVGHEVKTARQMGWSTIDDGELLALAEKNFDVFITVDRNLSFQQNLMMFDVVVIVLCANSNRLADLRPLVPKLLTSIPRAQRGVPQFIRV